MKKTSTILSMFTLLSVVAGCAEEIDYEVVDIMDCHIHDVSPMQEQCRQLRVDDVCPHDPSDSHDVESMIMSSPCEGEIEKDVFRNEDSTLDFTYTCRMSSTNFVYTIGMYKFSRSFGVMHASWQGDNLSLIECKKDIYGSGIYKITKISELYECLNSIDFVDGRFWSQTSSAGLYSGCENLSKICWQ